MSSRTIRLLLLLLPLLAGVAHATSYPAGAVSDETRKRTEAALAAAEDEVARWAVMPTFADSTGTLIERALPKLVLSLTIEARYNAIQYDIDDEISFLARNRAADVLVTESGALRAACQGPVAAEGCEALLLVGAGLQARAVAYYVDAAASKKFFIARQTIGFARVELLRARSEQLAQKAQRPQKATATTTTK